MRIKFNAANLLTTQVSMNHVQSQAEEAKSRPPSPGTQWTQPLLLRHRKKLPRRCAPCQNTTAPCKSTPLLPYL